MRQPLIATALLLLAASSAARAPRGPSTKPIEFYNPQWSPDGRSIVFESTLDGKFSIYTIHADGTDLRRLTVNDANNEQPNWSPDGRRIVFSSDRAGHLDLYVMDADGSHQMRLTTTPGGAFYQSSFSPDGRWIVFQGRTNNKEVRDRVIVIRSDGTEWRQLSDSTVGAEGPRWSRDGETITFSEVPYPKRFWDEMGPADVQAARAGAHLVSVRRDGHAKTRIASEGPDGSRPKWARDWRHALVVSERDGRRVIQLMTAGTSATRRIMDAEGIDDLELSPTGQQLAFTKSSDGWPGLYVYDIESRREQLIVGGRGAGPFGYLRTAALTAATDTLDTYTSPRTGGAIERGDGAYVVRQLSRTSRQRWELNDTWFDATGNVTARQYSRTAPASLATELATVRAPTDSASITITADRVTAWVVPAREQPRLFDGPATGERYAGSFVAAAIALAKPNVGQLFIAPVATLYGGNPIPTTLDSLRVVRRDTLYRDRTPIAVLVIERPGGSQTWVDEVTGGTLLARGNAGPERWWWHIRRGITPPAPK